MLYRLIYTSKATKRIRTRDFVRIMTAARFFNKDHDITGLLVYSQHTFVQIIDGPNKAVIDEVMKRIRASTSHHSIDILLEGEASESMFPTWSMGLSLPSHHLISLHPFRNRWVTTANRAVEILGSQEGIAEG
jgi:hypothetical protein